MALFRMVALAGLNLPRHQVRSTVGTAISAFGGKRHISVRHMSLSCDRLFGKSLATGRPIQVWNLVSFSSFS